MSCTRFFRAINYFARILPKFSFLYYLMRTFSRSCSTFVSNRCKCPCQLQPCRSRNQQRLFDINMASTLQPGPQVSRIARVFFLAFVLLFIAALSFGPTGPSALAPENASWRLKKTSKTIEERVEHILKHTPLIGIETLDLKSPDSLEEVKLTSLRRRAQRLSDFSPGRLQEPHQ